MPASYCGSLLFLGTYSGGLIGASVSYEAAEGAELIADGAKSAKNWKSGAKGSENSATTGEAESGAKKGKNSNKIQVKLIFAVGAHSGSVRCVAASGTCLISGGSDETVQIYDTSRSCEGGSLDGLTTDIHSVAMLTQGTALHVMSGGADGKLAVYKRSGRDWRMLGLLKGHKKESAVTGVALHRSGKSALSVAGAPENKLRLWDLVSGTCAVSQPFLTPPLGVYWSPDCEIYAVLFADKVLLRHATIGDCFKHFQAHEEENDTAAAAASDDAASTAPSSPSNRRTLQFSSLNFLTRDCLAIGCTNGDILIIHFAIQELSSDQSIHQSSEWFESGEAPLAKLILTEVARFDVGIGQKIRGLTPVLPGGVLAAVAAEGVVHFLRHGRGETGDASLDVLLLWDSNARVTCMASNYHGC